MTDENDQAEGEVTGEVPPTHEKPTFLPMATSSEPDLEDAALVEDNLATSLIPSSPVRPGVSRLQRASIAARKLGHFVASITLVAIIILVPWVIRDGFKAHRRDLAAFHSAFVLMLGAVILSTRLVYLHLTHWYMPDVQKYVVRIVWMVPIYAVQSWLSLRFHEARIYIDTIRDLYEAYVISSFVYYLIELLGGEDSFVQLLRTKDEHYGQHQIPFQYFLKPWAMGFEFMLQCKHGVLQYVVVKTAATILIAIIEPMGLYGEGEFDWRKGYAYIAFCLNISVCYALYVLVKLFHAVSPELYAPINWHPLGKFLCIKGVVFFTWWQSVAIFFLRAHGFLRDVGTWRADDVANGLQDYLVCVEMLFFAIAHSFTFTYKECLPSTMERMSSNEQSEEEVEYAPPAIRTLHRPMAFRDALWSSTMPKETLNDIRRMRNGVLPAANQAMSPGSISLRGINSDEAEHLNPVPQVQDVINTAPQIPDLTGQTEDKNA